MGGLISADNPVGKETRIFVGTVILAALLGLAGLATRGPVEGRGMAEQHNYFQRIVHMASQDQVPDTARLRWSEADFAK